MRKTDEEFSSLAHSQLREKVNAIYASHQQRQKQEEENRRRQDEQAKQEKKQREAELSGGKPEPWENPAIAKTRAENKNYGAE